MGVIGNILKKNKLVYGPEQSAEDSISQVGAKIKSDTEKARSVAESTPHLGGGTLTVKYGDGSYSKKGSSVPLGASLGESKVTQNNTYTNAPSYDKNTDYGKLLKDGMAAGLSVKELMPYWNARQQKIAADPALSPYMYDEIYKRWKDYSGAGNNVAKEIQQAISAGASADDVEILLQKRLYKISQNPNLTDYAYDEVYQAAREYIDSKREKEKEAQEYKERKSQIEPFEYNFTEDPLYQNYLRQAREQGNMAMNDTLAAAATAAGGMNSYAISAAQGMQNNYLQRVNDVIPELYQLAYNKYLNKQNMDLELDERDYSRWLNERAYNDSRSDLLYDRNMAQEQWDYTKAQNEKEWNYGVSETTRKNAVAAAESLISVGEMPSDEIIAASGLSKEYWQSLYNGYMRLNFSSGSGGGDEVYSNPNEKPEDKENDATGGMVPVQGYRYVSSDELVKMINDKVVDCYDVDGETVYYIKDNVAGRSRLIWQ